MEEKRWIDLYKRLGHSSFSTLKPELRITIIEAHEFKYKSCMESIKIKQELFNNDLKKSNLVFG